MKVIKPGKLGVLSRCFEHERKFHLGVSVLAFVPLGLPGTTLLSEVEMWKVVAPRLGAEGALDMAIPKLRSEFLINGIVYAPRGVPQPKVPVRAEVGTIQTIKKDALVHGDRYWIGSNPSNPLPFTEMPLSWEKAYGGPDFAKNPLGKGAVEVEVNGVKMRPLPNVESPRELCDHPRRRPEPVGFGAVDISWPQRRSMAGTHDQRWLENEFPGFARDIDWGIHNLASRDQQREEPWEGGEAYRFDNLHPTLPHITGTLPRVRARVFLSRSHAMGQERPSFGAHKAAARRVPTRLEEVELKLRTLWFLPDLERAVLVWTGSTRVAEEDGADVVQLVAAAEHGERPKPVEHYVRAVVDRLDPEYGLIAALREHELLPEDLDPLPDEPPDEDQELAALEGLTQQNLHRRMVAETEKAREIVASHGLDPDVHGPTMPQPPPKQPKLDELPDIIAKIKEDAAKEQAKIEARRDQAMADIAVEVDEAGIEGFTSETLEKEMKADKIGPPTWTAAGQLADLERIAVECRMQGHIADELEEIVRDEAMFEQWLAAERDMMAAYRKTAHYQTAAPPMPASLHESTRERVLQAVAAGEDFGTLNFTGATLQGMDLRGADLRRALFESADLRGADLRGARLDEAVLAHACLADARFDGACLREANLGKAQLEGTVLDDADLRDAILAEAELQGAKLRRATLTGAMLYKVRLCEVDAAGLVGEQLALLEAVLERVDFRGAKLPRTTFSKADLRGSSFGGAELQSCTFLACDLREVSLFGAKLGNARFVEECQLDGAMLGEADLTGANLRGTSLVGADLRKATLDDADLCECNLAGAKLYQAVARRTRFEVSDLRNAELMSANLMHASLARATIQGADLRGANLYGADMARVRGDAEVKLDMATLVKVRIHPRHVAQKAET
ncbi:DUF2169 family type VI secretion system accessory protein [Paraliomyxa miuraensis]|uniref:DUF2169 family type VI secretion system accessory protein n=1 Tax=Paraliomyxa miuraensis TaxID=376150 RepID=UPI0022598CFF|nr:DUF2169 domain-containing protein [Paraliomyxa miuraensis]MCX4246561.1 pentapeptide repeat-containing protein [Paraliomyxa miuraensis]